MRRGLPRRDVQRRAAPRAPAGQGPRDRGRGIAEPLWAASASDLARRIRAREVSSVEAVDSCLARIAEVNPRINAVIALAEDAREQARASFVRLARGEIDGPLHGVPFTIKDSLDTAGLVTTAGTVGWRNRVPDRDATVVARLRAAGGILLGKTNTPEFTWSNETDNDVYGRTSNPYDLARTPGGSSRWRGRDRRRRRLAVRHRQRHRRQHPPAVARVRRRRHQADAGPRAADRPLAGLRAGSSRRSSSSGRSPAASTTSRWSCRSSPGRTGSTRMSRRSRSGTRTGSTSGRSV